ncbi:MAG: MFS transporter [Chloroflexota bacterium]
MAGGEPEEERGQEHGFRYVVAQPSFRLIWFAQLMGQLADKFLMFSLIILAYHVSGGSTPVAFTLLAYTVPAVVIAPVAGDLADRFDRKLIMVATNLARALLIALIPIASLVPGLRGEFLHLLVITFLFSAVGQLFSPAEAAAIPTLLPRRALLAANSLVLITMVTTLVMGGALAPLVSRYDIYAPYWLAVALFAAAGILILLARIPRAEPFAPTGRHPFTQVAVELRDGMAALRSSPVLLLSFYELSLAVLVMFMMFTLAPAYVSRVIGITEQDSYVILLPATTGALLSALALGQFGRGINKAWLLVGGLAATGLTLIALASVPQLVSHVSVLRGYVRVLGSGFSLLLGVEFGALMIPALTYLMENTEDHVRGRVFALLFMVINGVTAVPVLLAAALADTFGIDHVIAGLGGLLIVTGIAAAGFAQRVFGAATSPAPPRSRRPARPSPGT